MAHRFTRRDALKAAGLGLGALGASGALAACSSGLKGSNSGGSTSTLKIGYVSPQTGPLASFATGDNYIINKLKPVLSKGFHRRRQDVEHRGGGQLTASRRPREPPRSPSS